MRFLQDIQCWFWTDINLLTRFCDRIVLLSKGKIITSGSASEVVNRDSVKEVFGIEVEIVSHDGTVYVLPTGTVMDSCDND